MGKSNLQIKEYNHQYYLNNRENFMKQVKSYWFKKKYGLTLSEVGEMAKAQNGKCYVCKKVEKLHVDHDHQTGQVRKLLCSRCNTWLGFLEGDLQRIKNLLAYLKEHGCQTPFLLK